MNAFRNLLSVGCLIVLIPSVGNCGQAKPKDSCAGGPHEIVQLPCVPNRISFEVPRELLSLRGSWEYQTESGEWKVCPNLLKGAGPTLSGTTYEPEQPCTTGEIDLAERCRIWIPGSYWIRWRTREREVRIGPVLLTILEPHGVDQEVYEKLILPRLQGHLLGQGADFWVYGGMDFPDRPPIYDQIIQNYPTSIYAGWVLWKVRPPLTGNRMGSLQDPDKALRSFCDRGGGEENTQRHLELVQSKLRNYEEPLGQFLQAHPDFPHAQDLRRRYAMCLGLTGRMSEAMIQIEILAKGEGPKAEEAKAFLAEKDKEASPKEGSDKEK